MRIGNPNYNLSNITVPEDRYIEDKLANRGEQVILDTAAELARLYKQLPPEDAPQFAEAFQLLAQRLKIKAGRPSCRTYYPPSSTS
jgi:hypothetical protein